MISGSIAIEKNDPPKVVPYKVALETEDGVRFYVPANLVSITYNCFFPVSLSTETISSP